MSRKKRSSKASKKKRKRYQQKRALRTESKNTLNLSEASEDGEEKEAWYQNQTSQKDGYKSVLMDNDDAAIESKPGMRTDFQLERKHTEKDVGEEAEVDSNKARKKRSQRRARQKTAGKRQDASSEQLEADIRASPSVQFETNNIKSHAAHNSDRNRSSARYNQNRSERYNSEKEPRYQNYTSAFNVLSDDSTELFDGDDDSISLSLPDIGKGVTGLDFRRGRDNDIRFGTHDEKPKHKNNLLNTEFEMKREYSRERDKIQKESQKPKKHRRRHSDKLYDKRREEDGGSRNEEKFGYTVFNTENIYQPNKSDNNSHTESEQEKSERRHRAEQSELRSRKGNDTPLNTRISAKNQPERGNSDIEFGVHEEKNQRKSRMNTEFEMKRSSSAARDMQSKSEQDTSKRTSRTRRAVRRSSAEQNGREESNKYSAFNQADAYDSDEKRAVIDSREDDVQFGRKSGRDTEFLHSGEHDAEFSHSGERDTEFSHSGEHDTEFSYSRERDAEFSHNGERDEKFKIKHFDADIELKRKRSIGSTKRGRSEEKSDNLGQRTDGGLAESIGQKGTDKSKQAFNVLSDEAAAKAEADSLSGKNAEYLFKRGIDSDIRFGMRGRADELFKRNRGEFELKYIRKAKDVLFARSNGEIEFKYNSSSVRTKQENPGTSERKKFQLKDGKAGRLKQDEFRYSERKISSARDIRDTGSKGSESGYSEKDFETKSESNLKYRTDEHQKYKLNFDNIKVSADVASATENAAGTVSAAAAASNYAKSDKEQSSGADVIERTAFRLKQDIHFERQRMAFSKTLKAPYENKKGDKKKHNSRSKDEKASEQEQQNAKQKSGTENSKHYNYKSDDEYKNEYEYKGKTEYRYHAETKRSSGQEQSQKKSEQRPKQSQQKTDTDTPETASNRFRSERIKKAEAKAKNAGAKADRAENKLRQLQEKQQRHNKLKFGSVPGMVMHQVVGEAEIAVKNKLRDRDDNAGMEIGDKAFDYAEETVRAAYRYHRNKPYRVANKAKRLRKRANRAANRLNFEKEAAEKAARQGAEETARKTGEAAKATAKKKAEKEAQQRFYRKMVQTRLYKKAYQYSLFRKGGAAIHRIALKFAKGAKKAVQAVISLLSSKAKLIIAAVAAGIVALMMCVSLFMLLITSIAGGYIEENITDTAEVSAFGSYWVSMEDELRYYPLDDDYPDDYDVYYFGQDNIGIDMPKLMAYYNAINGKSVYDGDSVLGIENLFDYIYTWDILEIVHYEGSEDEYHEIYADLIVADIDELIGDLTGDQLELYNVCYEIYTEDEEYIEVWDGL